MKTLDHRVYLDALNQTNNKPYVPVWFLRQAGRYMPEYRAVRSKFTDFFEMIKQPEVCCELTMQPLNKFPLDAAITFSDILTVPEAMGLEIKFIEKRGPVFSKSIIKDGSLNLSIDGVNEKLNYVYQATELIKSNINIPLIGFAGSPWTIFTYMFYGESPKDFSHISKYVKNSSDYVHQILEDVTNASAKYLKYQIEHGADCVQIFDSWGGMLSPVDYQEFSWPYINQIIEALKNDAPVIAFGKGCWFALREMANSNAAALGIDWTCSAQNARYLTGGKITLQGNFDPSRLLSPPNEIKRMVTQMINDFGKDRYIVNLGHGILPTIPVDHAKAFIDAVKDYSA